MTKSVTTNEDNRQSTGKCPVDHKNRSLWNVLGISSSKEQDRQQQSDLTTNSSSSSLQPASLEEAAKYAQTPQPDQRLPLSTHRAKSSIPRGNNSDDNNNNNNNNNAEQQQEKKNPSHPHHQLGSETSSTWVYPSEQQVFNAMKRKGWQGIEEESIPSFLQIHNSVNERSWRYVQSWETNKDITLVKFQGRPNELTPKAWIWSNLFFGDKPFDRHDWYIDNGVENSKRYVLDFYMKDEFQTRTGLPRVDIDVRPALDNPSAVVARATRFVSELFPGIATEIQRYQQQSSSSSEESSSQSPPRPTTSS